jgi:hypothetical protein
LAVSADGRWRGDVVWFATVVCAFLGPILGCVVYGVLEGKPWLFLGVDIAGLPFAAYAFLSFAPIIGLIAGHLGGRLCLALVDRGYARGAFPRRSCLDSSAEPHRPPFSLPRFTS